MHTYHQRQQQKLRPTICTSCVIVSVSWLVRPVRRQWLALLLVLTLTLALTPLLKLNRLLLLLLQLRVVFDVEV